MAPTISIATINRVVATGRRMKMREGFMRLGLKPASASLRLRRFAARPVAPRTWRPGSARLAWWPRAGGLSRAGRSGRGIGQLHWRAVAQAITALGNHDFAGLEASGHCNPFTIDHAQGHRAHGDGAIRIDDIHESARNPIGSTVAHR